MARIVDEYRIEYRPSARNSQGVALAWRTILRGTAAEEFLVTGLTNGEPGQFRLVAKNSGGETVGPVFFIPKIGATKFEGRIPEHWFDDPYVGPGEQWSVKQMYLRFSDGRGGYVYDRVERSEELNDIDEADERVVWAAGGYYERDTHVVTRDQVTAGGTVIRFQNLWACRTTHQSLGDNDGPVVNANGYWEFISNWYDGSTAAPDPPDPTPVASNIGITVRTTIRMDEMRPLVNTFVDPDLSIDDDRAHHAGEYAFVNRHSGGVVRVNEWADIITLTNLVSMSLRDSSNRGWNVFHEHLIGTTGNARLGQASGGVKLVCWYSNGKWVRFNVLSAYTSENGLRCNLNVTVDGYNASDNANDIPTGIKQSVQFRFDLATPTTS